MKKRLSWLLAGLIIVIWLTLLAISCGGGAPSTPSPSPSPSPTTPTGEAPLIAHGLEGFEDCNSGSCHGDGGINPNPDDHVSFTNDDCLNPGCHEAE